MTRKGMLTLIFLLYIKDFIVLGNIVLASFIVDLLFSKGEDLK